MRLLIGLVLLSGCGAPTGTTATDPSQHFDSPGSTPPPALANAELETNPQGAIIQVRLEYRQVIDSDLRALTDLSHLQSLTIASCPRITINALVPLRTAPHLQRVAFTFCPRINDKDLRQLRYLDQLTHLSLDGCTGITNAGLVHLESLPRLETLSLRDTWVTYDRLVDFQAKQPKCRVRHTWTAQDRTEGSPRREHTALYYRGLGMGHARQGMADEALAALHTVVRLLPWDAQAYNDRGYAHKLGNHLDEAIENYTAAIHLHPNFALAYFNRGIAYRDRGETAKAEIDFAAAESLGYDENTR